MPDLHGATTDPRTILPDRPLRARPPINTPWAGWLLFVPIAMIGILVYLAGWIAPVLVTDGLVRAAAVLVSGGHLVEGSCTSHAFIRICDLVLIAGTGAETFTRNIHYVFGTFSISSLNVRVIGDPAHPQWLTTNLGLDYFWNRVATLLLVLAFFIAIITIATWNIIRVTRLRAWWHRVEMKAVPLTLLNVTVQTHDAIWTVRAGSGHARAWTMPKFALPFVLGPADCILGLMHEDNDYNMVPLDSELKWVALSEAERAAALGSVAAVRA